MYDAFASFEVQRYHPYLAALLRYSVMRSLEINKNRAFLKADREQRCGEFVAAFDDAIRNLDLSGACKVSESFQSMFRKEPKVAMWSIHARCYTWYSVPYPRCFRCFGGVFWRQAAVRQLVCMQCVPPGVVEPCFITSERGEPAPAFQMKWTQEATDASIWRYTFDRARFPT